MSFDWAKRMRFMIIGGIVLLVLIVGGVTAFLVMYKAPSCVDKIQNHGEKGIDCGGPCSYLCTSQVSPATVLFTRPLSLPGGRTDVIAYIQNPNKNAQAKGAPYTIELYGADATIIARVQGFVDLPAGKTAPIFVRAATQGSIVARAFIDIDQSKIPWTSVTGTRVTPRPTEIVFTDGTSPRLQAKLLNESYDPSYDVHAIAVVFDANGTAIAASETLVPGLRAQSSAPITFTWNEPFISAVARYEVLTTVPLP